MKKMQSFVAQIFPPFRTLCQRKRKSTATWVQIKGQGMPSELAPKNLRAQEIVDYIYKKEKEISLNL